MVLLNPHYDYGLWMLAQGLEDQQMSLTGVSLLENVFDWGGVDRLGAQLDDQVVSRPVVDSLHR